MNLNPDRTPAPTPDGGDDGDIWMIVAIVFIVLFWIMVFIAVWLWCRTRGSGKSEYKETVPATEMYDTQARLVE